MADTAVSYRAKIGWIYAICVAFIAFTVFSLSKEWYWGAILPVALGIVLLSIYRLDIILLTVAFCTPLAIVLNDKASGPALSLPTEPLLFGALLVFVLHSILRPTLDRRVLRHPITVAVAVMLAWKFFTTLTSSLPVVSLKHLLSQCWFIIPMYLLGTQLFRKTRNIHRFIWLYVISLLVVIGYTLFEHAQQGWTQESAHWVMYPFYNDHTAYAAALALFIPAVIMLSRSVLSTPLEKFLAALVTVILMIAIILSYTRAAWISLIVAALCFLIYYFRVGFGKVALGGGILLALFLMFKGDILMKLEKNRQDSATDINKHLQSISNISTDASNLERINRWNSALRMWRERPFLGWGPGTYQFNYAPFQKSEEMTTISTNAGDRGNAHSEYIGPLAETGVLGMLLFILVVVIILYRGTILYSTSPSPEVQRITLGVLLGLITYLTHGVLNNFLDTDKLAVPFWAFIGILVSLDVYGIASDNKAGVPEKESLSL